MCEASKLGAPQYNTNLSSYQALPIEVESRNTATISAVGILLGAMANVRPFSTPLSSSTHSSYEEVFNTHLSLRVEPALSGDILLNSRQNFMSCFPFRIIDFSDVFPNYRTP